MIGHCVSYEIDERDYIVSVDEGWDVFAAANDALALRAECVLNQPLMAFIADRTCRHLYLDLIAHCRGRHARIAFQYRCDGPGVRRYMQMEMTPLAGGGVRFDSRVVREEQRDRILLFDACAVRGDDTIAVCSWCKRIRVADEAWVSLEAAIEVLELFDRNPLPQLSHGICPECADDMRRRMRAAGPGHDPDGRPGQ